MNVEVCYAEADHATRVAVILPDDARVADAVGASGLVVRLSLDPAVLTFAVFGRRVDGQAPLTEGDRVELTRPLVIDPKEARRLRAEARTRERARR